MIRIIAAALMALAIAGCASNPSGDMGTAMGKAAAGLIRGR